MGEENKNSGDIDLVDASDDSSNKVKFGSEEFRRPARSDASETPKIIRWVIKCSGGLIKNEKQATYVLFGFVAVMVVISLFVIFSGGTSQPASGTIPSSQFVPQ